MSALSIKEKLTKKSQPMIGLVEFMSQHNIKMKNVGQLTIERKWLCTREAARYLDISESQIHQLKSTGVLQCRKLGGTTDLNMGENEKILTIRWYNPKTGDALQSGSVKTIDGSEMQNIGHPPSDEN